jgi:hypothetical protein
VYGTAPAAILVLPAWNASARIQDGDLLIVGENGHSLYERFAKGQKGYPDHDNVFMLASWTPAGHTFVVFRQKYYNGRGYEYETTVLYNDAGQIKECFAATEFRRFAYLGSWDARDSHLVFHHSDPKIMVYGEFHTTGQSTVNPPPFPTPYHRFGGDGTTIKTYVWSAAHREFVPEVFVPTSTPVRSGPTATAEPEHSCPDGFSIVDPPDGFRTAQRLLSVRGCGGIPGAPIRIYVVTDAAYLQDRFAVPEPDGRWQVGSIVLGGYPLPYTHRVYAITGQDGQPLQSNTIEIIKVKE